MTGICNKANQHFLDLFWKEFEANKIQQTIWYVNNTINNKFKENFLHEKQDIGNLKAELLSITSEEEIDELYANRLATIETIIESKKYEEALAIVNFKGKLTKYIAKQTIVDNYPDRVLGLIKSDNALMESIKKKYFLPISQ